MHLPRSSISSNVIHDKKLFDSLGWPTDHDKPKYTPEQRLCAAVLLRALADAFNFKDALNNRTARNYLKFGTRAIFPLELVLDALFDNPEATQAEIIKVIDQEERKVFYGFRKRGSGVDKKDLRNLLGRIKHGTN